MNLVLLRGLTRSAWHWQGFPAILQARLSELKESDFKIWTLELAGVGDRREESGPEDIPAMVADIRNQLINENIQFPVVLVGVSMGGMIASEWAHQHPHEVAQLHMVNTSFGRFSPPWQRLKPNALIRLLWAKCSLTQATRRTEHTILRLTSNHPVTPETLSTWTKYAQNHPLKLKNLYGQLKASSSFKGTSKAPIEKVFLYVSMKDRLVSASCSSKLAQGWQKPVTKHCWAGHDLSLDDPEWLADKIYQALLPIRTSNTGSNT